MREGPCCRAIHREFCNLTRQRARLIGGLALGQVLNRTIIHLEPLRHFIGIVRSIAAVLGLDHHFPGSTADRHLIARYGGRPRYHFVTNGQTGRIRSGIQGKDLIGGFPRNGWKGNALHGLAIVDPTQQIIAGGQTPARPAVRGRDQRGRILYEPLGGIYIRVRAFLLRRQIDIAVPGLAVHNQMLMRHRMVAIRLHVRGQQYLLALPIRRPSGTP